MRGSGGIGKRDMVGVRTSPVLWPASCDVIIRVDRKRADGESPIKDSANHHLPLKWPSDLCSTTHRETPIYSAKDAGLTVNQLL